MSSPAFVADCMLGRLARWLRLLGYDTLYFRRAADADLLATARAEGRILLTRDRDLARRAVAPGVLRIESTDPREQLRQVVAALGLVPGEEAWCRRCTVCNRSLEEVTPDAVRDQVPPYVLATQPRFLRCPGCARVYWAATHVERLRAALRAALGARP